MHCPSLISLIAASTFLFACSNEVRSPDLSDQPIVTREDANAIAKDAKSDENLPGRQNVRNAFDLPGMFDCLRKTGGVVVAAHRGGPYPGYPENAIETLQHGYDNGIRVFEIDIAESQDGVLFLLHDRTFTRTTTGDGFVAEKDWADIRKLRLVDNDGRLTNFSVPSLEAALNWAVETGAILELDKKPTTSFRNIIKAVENTSAQNNTIIITYNDQQASEVAKLAPDLMMTATAYGDRNIGKLNELGVKTENLIAWTGTSEPDFAAWQRLRKEGVEPAFGTLGRPGERLDDLYLADGDGSEYADLTDKGLVLIATDKPLEVAGFIEGDDIAREQCGL